jgi:hypothetical protein
MVNMLNALILDLSVVSINLNRRQNREWPKIWMLKCVCDVSMIEYWSMTVYNIKYIQRWAWVK